jgi:hypothetical protein
MAIVVADLQSKTILEQPRGPAARDELKASTLPTTTSNANEQLSEAVLTRRVETGSGAIATWALIVLPTSTLVKADITALNRYKNLAAGSILVCANGVFTKTTAPGTDTWVGVALA